MGDRVGYRRDLWSCVVVQEHDPRRKRIPHRLVPQFLLPPRQARCDEHGRECERSDLLAFKDLMNENSGHYYANQELYQLFDPMNPELPYLYDNFDWGHCHTAALGHDAAHATDDTLREGGAQGTGDESIFWETQWE